MSPSIGQKIVRQAFKNCVSCFNFQPQEGGATPPNNGPRSRESWFEAAEESGLWYYDYFIQQSMPYFLAGQAPPWCISGPINFNNAGSSRSTIPDSFLSLGSYAFSGKSADMKDRAYLSIDISALTEEDVNLARGLLFSLTWQDQCAVEPFILPYLKYDVLWLDNDGFPAGLSWNSPGNLVPLGEIFAFPNTLEEANQVNFFPLSGGIKAAKAKGYSNFCLCVKYSGENLPGEPDCYITILTSYTDPHSQAYLIYY